jgi:16S rRNA (guanine966-N2)-methyltransferase
MMHNQVRIIGGKYKGRKVSFPETLDLRPTPDRVKVTLFNWLASLLPEARCLDLFAGSGVLGFEALSRGANSVTFIEKNPLIATSIEENAKKLGVENVQIIRANALSWLETANTSYDIIFLDPPYKSNLLPLCFSLLEKNHWLHPKAKIYFESYNSINATDLPPTWELLRDKKAGHIYYYLAQKN